MLNAHRIPTKALTGYDLHVLQFGNPHPDKRDKPFSNTFRNYLALTISGLIPGEEIQVRQYDVSGAVIPSATVTLSTIGPHEIYPVGVNPRYVAFEHINGDGRLIIIDAMTHGHADVGDLPPTPVLFIEGRVNPDQDAASIATTGTASLITDLGYVIDAESDYFLMQAAGGNVRITLTGDTPTADYGLVLADGGAMQLSRAEMIAAQVITDTGTPTLEIVAYIK